VVVRLAAGAVVRPREAVERIPSRPKSQLSGADTNKKKRRLTAIALYAAYWACAW
jgi:hypothetical protein